MFIVEIVFLSFPFENIDSLRVKTSSSEGLIFHQSAVLLNIFLCVLCLRRNNI